MKIALLAPVPGIHLYSGMFKCGKSGKIVFSTGFGIRSFFVDDTADPMALMDKEQRILSGTSILVYAARPEGGDPSNVDGYWEVRNVQRLKSPISFNAMRNFNSGKAFAFDFVPERPMLIKYQEA